MKLKTSELTDIALDWAVLKCMHSGAANDARFLEIFKHQRGAKQAHCYSLSWAEGGPIIEREKMGVFPTHDGWAAGMQSGPTPLIAAMRCYVKSQLGDEVDVPSELTDTNVELFGETK